MDPATAAPGTWAAGGILAPTDCATRTASDRVIPAPRASQYTERPDAAYRSGVIAGVAGGSIEASTEFVPTLRSDTRDPGAPAACTRAPSARQVLDTSPPGRTAVCTSVIGTLPASSVIRDAAVGTAAAPADGAASSAASTAILSRTAPRDR